MTRLIDSLLNERFLKSLAGPLIEILKHDEVLVIDNVARYYFQHRDEFINQDVSKSYPNIAPPFENFFMEFKVPSFILQPGEKRPDTAKILGVHFSAFEKDDFFEAMQVLSDPENGISRQMKIIAESSSDFPDLKWFLVCQPFYEKFNGRAGFRYSKFVFPVDEDGCLSKNADGKEQFSTVMDLEYLLSRGVTYEKAVEMREMESAAIVNIIFPCLLALSFMHCKNVVLSAPVRSYPPGQKKNEKLPSITYRMLDIEPMKTVLRTEGNSEKTGLKQALSICRGHFKDYREHGLFGKNKGLYWWDSHVRGSHTEGIVIKDYVVKSPKAQA